MRLSLVLALLLSSTLSFAGLFEQGSVNFSTDTRTVVVSSITSSPTKILSRDSYITGTQLVNNTSFFVLLSTASNNFNAATTFSLPPCTTSNCPAWSPDGPMVPYWGQMFAVIAGTSTSATGNTISVFRTK